jgi:anaerobic selenocysteine-containing dehydrogenase
MPISTARTFCRFCHANCAMLVDVEDGKAVAVRGDPEDPVYGGYTCIKGRQLVEAHYHPERLLSCQKKVDGQFTPITTEAALDEIAAKLRAIIDEHGPDSVAVYGGTYAFQNSAAVGAAMSFAQGLGSKHYYTSVTLDQPAKVFTPFQYGMWEAGGHSFDEADVVMQIGNNPLVSHYSPPGGLPPFSPSKRLRDSIKNGLQLIVADPRESDLAKHAAIYLPVKPGEDPALLAGMLRVLIAEQLYDAEFAEQYVDGFNALRDAVEPFTPEVAAARAGVDADMLVAAARMFGGKKKGMVSAGTGPEMAGNATLTQYLIGAINIICGRFCREGEKSSIPRLFFPASPRRAQVTPPMKVWGEGFPASRFRGLTHLGTEMPGNVMADEMLTPGEGQVRALINIGGNPITAFPNQAKMSKALDGLDLLVSIDVRAAAQTASRSDYILAPTMSLEREDISSLSEWFHEIPYARYTEAMIAGPDDLQDEYALLWGLAKRLGNGMPLAGGPCPMDSCPDKATFLDLMVAGCPKSPSTVRADSKDGRAMIYADAHPMVAPAEEGHTGKFDLTGGDMPAALAHYHGNDPVTEGYPLKLISRRSRHRFNSTGGHLSKLKEQRTTNPAHMNPADMAEMGLYDGQIVKIRSAHGEIPAIIKTSDAVRSGVVSMAHGYGNTDSNGNNVAMQGSSTNRLVSDTNTYDPITGMPLQSAIPIAVVAN